MTKPLHSPFGPSSLERRLLCPGSYHAEKDLAEEESENAKRGTMLHEVFLKAVGKTLKLDDHGKTDCPEFDALDGYDQSAISFCRRVVFEELVNYKQPQLICEISVELPFIKIPDETETPEGTPDLVVVEAFNEATIFDFKFGLKPVTEASANMQLAAYAAAIKRKFDLQTVSVVLCMPFTRFVSRHKYMSDNFHYIERNIAEIVTRALNPDAPRTPGDKQCKYCKARGQCPALAANATQLPVKAEPAQLTHQQIADWLNKADLIEEFIGAVRQRAHAIIEAGGQIPGWKLGEGRKSRDWIASDVAQTAIGDLAVKAGKQPLSIYDLKSPAQIEALLGKGKAVKEVLAPLIETKPGKMSLKKEEPVNA